MCELQGVVPSIATYFFSTLYRTLATILAPTVAHGNGQIPVKVVNELLYDVGLLIKKNQKYNSRNN
jgi:hypothetical protein